jgi:DNA-binding MarR family transcriptional regulator
VHYAYNHLGFYETMMNNRLVQDVSQIILVLRDGKTNVNAIIKKTGIYKNKVHEANDFLEKAGLAVRIKDKEVHRQMIFVQLTKFGQELAGFIIGVEQFERSFDQLKKTIRHVYDLPEGTQKSAARSILSNRGLNHNEINCYEEDFNYAADFEEDSLSVLIDGILNKHALFLLEFHPNRYAKEFLNEVISRRLSNYLLMKTEGKVKDEHFRCKKCGHDISNQVRIYGTIEENGIRLFNFLEDYVHIPFSNRHISNQVQDILNCLFSVFRLPKEHIEQKIKEIESLPPPRVSPYLDEAEAKRNIDTRKKLYNYVAGLNAST